MVKKQRRNSFHVPSLPPLGSNKPQAPPRPLPPPPGAHFLRDVNLNGNLLDIPDPPSPPKRSTRRQSSPLLRPLPLHDRTNEEDESNVNITCNEPATTTTTTLTAAAGSNTQKRSRKSLCHVPSPHPTESLPHETTASSSSSSLICFDDDPDMIVSSKRQKRRESMILPSNCMAPMKQDDGFHQDIIMNDSTTTHESSNMHVGEENEDNHNNSSAMATHNKKKRLSIVLPSDIASFQQQVTSKLLECTDETSTVQFSQDDDDETPRMATRTNKRQSIMLPADALILEDVAANEYFGQLQTVQTNESNRQELVSEKKTNDTVEPEAISTATTSIDETTTTCNNNTDTTTNASTSNHIASLVREYCSLPQSQRNDSKQAHEIQRLTGYALIPQAHANKKKADQSSPSPQNLAASKRQLLLQLGDMVDVMDKRKTLDARELEESTSCRVERSRNGKYRYFHTVTNRKVRPSEYQELYLAAIQQSRAKMAVRIQTWLRENDGSVSEQQEQDEEQCCQKLSALIQKSQQQQQESDDAVDEHRAASESDMEESPASESSESTALDKQIESQASVAQVTVQQATDEKEDASCMEEGDTSILSLEEDTVPRQDEPKAVSDSTLHEDTDESMELLLPLPSRQDTSDDPEIAAAEQRLWSEIDLALERYSRQVMAIRQARASERNDAS